MQLCVRVPEHYLTDSGPPPPMPIARVSVLLCWCIDRSLWFFWGIYSVWDIGSLRHAIKLTCVPKIWNFRVTKGADSREIVSLQCCGNAAAIQCQNVKGHEGQCQNKIKEGKPSSLVYEQSMSAFTMIVTLKSYDVCLILWGRPAWRWRGRDVAASSSHRGLSFSFSHRYGSLGW